MVPYQIIRFPPVGSGMTRASTSWYPRWFQYWVSFWISSGVISATKESAILMFFSSFSKGRVLVDSLLGPP